VLGHSSHTVEESKALLWRAPTGPGDWLPAYVVYGEGLYFELLEEPLRAWENRVEVQGRIASLRERHRLEMDRRKVEGVRSLRELSCFTSRPSADVAPHVRVWLQHCVAAGEIICPTIRIDRWLEY
jgi:hypothetical protein